MCNYQSIRSACAYAQSDQSLCLLLEYSMSGKLLTEHHLEFLSLKGGCTGSPESTLGKMPQCWKSHVTAHFHVYNITFACKRIKMRYLSKDYALFCIKMWRVNVSSLNRKLNEPQHLITNNMACVDSHEPVQPTIKLRNSK